MSYGWESGKTLDFSDVFYSACTFLSKSVDKMRVLSTTITMLKGECVVFKFVHVDQVFRYALFVLCQSELFAVSMPCSRCLYADEMS